MVDLRKIPTEAGVAPRPSPLAATVALSAVLLGGCEAATAIQEKAAEFGNYVSTQTSRAANYVMGRRSGDLVDDGTACFAAERVAFYGAVDEVTAAQRMQVAAQVGAVGAVVAAAFVDSTVAKVAALGLAATMAAVAIGLDQDRTRIEAVTTTFDDLIGCRRREAQQLNADLAKGLITRDAAERRMAQLRALVGEDVTIAQGTNAILAARTETFMVSAEEAKKQAPPPKTPEEAKKSEEEVKKTEVAIQTNQRVLQQQVASIEQAQKLVGEDGGFQLTMLPQPWAIGVTQGAA